MPSILGQFELFGAKKPVGVLAINPNPSLDDPFETIWNGIGMNTGNLFFTESVLRILRGEAQRIDFDFDPKLINKKFSQIVIPAANWINSYSDWGHLVERLEEVEIPVSILGVGIQAPSGLIDKVKFHPSALELLKTISRKSHSIGVRGEQTRNWLISQGVQNSEVIGCPSMFLRLNVTQASNSAGFVIQGTKYYAESSFAKKYPHQASLFRLAFSEKLDTIFQSEFEEMEFLTKRNSMSQIPNERLGGLLDQYGATDRESLESFVRGHGHVFFSIDDWAKFVSSKAGHLGSRIHGSILALNSNVPSVLFAHDSRIQEMADYAGITTVKGDEIERLGSSRELEKLIENVDLVEYRSTRATNAGTYRNFLKANGIRFRSSMLF